MTKAEHDHSFLALENLLRQQQDKVREWIVEQYSNMPPVFYCSVDVRNSGFKAAPVDTNLFPAGFNNIGKTSAKLMQKAITDYLNHYYPAAQNILLISEDFTRNTMYLNNFLALHGILSDAGYEVQCGSLTSKVKIKDPALGNLVITPLLKRNYSVVTVDQWTPDLILLNNDLLVGIHDLLINITQPIIPNPQLGWHRRRKHQHFSAYKQLLDEFSNTFQFDPWLLNCYFAHCDGVDFKQMKGLDQVAVSVDNMIELISDKYKQYGISNNPYVYIKADNGTFGMGVMSVGSGAEVMSINKHRRHSMNAIKYGVSNSAVLIQEGIPTQYGVESGAPAEHVPYLIGGKAITSLVRANPKRNSLLNLNALGAVISECSDKIPTTEVIVAELAALAAALENRDILA